MHTEASKAAFNGSADSDQEDIAFAEYRELAEIVLKGEYCLVFRRSKNWLQYLHVCTYELFVGADRVKKVAKAIKMVRQGQDSQRYEILEGFAEIKEKLEGLNVGLRELKKEKRHRKAR